MSNNMTSEDAINVVHVVGCELTSGGNEDVRKPLPGVREDVVFWIPREARSAWPEEVQLPPR